MTSGLDKYAPVELGRDFVRKKKKEKEKKKTL